MKTEFCVNIDERTYYRTNDIPGRMLYGETVIPGAQETVRVYLVKHGITLVDYYNKREEQCFTIYFDTLENMTKFQLKHL